MNDYDVAVIGGGIVGLATAHSLCSANGHSLVVLEAESKLAGHQTGNNSGVIHSGLYYRPGSLKASNCTTGRERMYEFCREHGVAHERCGKLVVATLPEEIERLSELERRGRENGLEGIERLDEAGLREREPHVRGLAGLWVPQTGIVDFTAVAETLGRLLRERGAEVRTSSRVDRIERRAEGFVLRAGGNEIRARNLVNCGGLHSDRIARMCGLKPKVRIIPFRGEYYELLPDRRHLVRNLIYPVPDPRFPFLGVHFTRMVDGGVEAGPNAVLALSRHGYSRFRMSPRDAGGIFFYEGFWRLAARYWKTGFGEVYRSFNKSAFVKALRKLMPEIRSSDLKPHGAGVRAQAIAPDGKLLDDFCIEEGERQLHVLNAPSPAATASLSIGATLADRASRTFAL